VEKLELHRAASREAVKQNSRQELGR
jgi:hypothetical protein